MRTRIVAIFSLVVFAGCFLEGDDVEWLSPKHPPYQGAVPVLTGQPEEILEAFRRLNEVRVQAGLKPVVFDARMSDDLNLHLRYVLLNHGSPAIAGLLVHQEDPSLPGYTPEGANAGIKSNLSTRPVQNTVDSYLNTLYHRTPILSPKLTRVGIGSETLGDLRRSGIMFEYGGDTAPYPIAYPGDGQEDVPLAFTDEIPDPVPEGVATASYPVTLIYGEHVTDVVAALYDDKGEKLPVYLSTPEKPAIDHPQGKVVCLFAHTPFMPGQRYTVEVSATHPNGERKNWRWSFKAQVPVELDPSDEAALIAAERQVVRITAPVARILNSSSRGLALGMPLSAPSLVVWFPGRSWRSFTDAGITSHDYLTGTTVSIIGEVKQSGDGYSLSLAHHAHLSLVQQEPVVVDTPTFDDLVTASGQLAQLKTAGVYPRDPSNDTLRMRLATADGTFLSAYISKATFNGHPGLSLDALTARSMLISGVLIPESESGTSYRIHVDRPEQWSFPDDEPEAIDTDEPNAVVNAHGRLVRSTGTVRNPKETDHLYFSIGSTSRGTTFVQVSDAAWQSLKSRGVTNFEDLNGQRVEVLGVPVKMTTTTNIYVERGDQIALLP